MIFSKISLKINEDKIELKKAYLKLGGMER